VYGEWSSGEHTATGLNLTSLQVWDAFEGEHLFTGLDPEHNTYQGRAHFSEMIALLGPPPPSLLARAGLSNKFFSEGGECSNSQR
jgi:serine/threonine-protein kinase SRPK3